MTTSLSRSFRLPSTLKIEEDAMVINRNQGISSILTAGSDCERSVKSYSSLRRTLSADMSSTKWPTQMKKIASSEEFSISSITDSSLSYEVEDEEQEEYDEEKQDQYDDSETEKQSQLDIWSSIQKEVYEKKELEKPVQFDIWSSIISQKEQENHNNKSRPPYIHPLVRRSASSLSEKSLEICTESLGSETGSDGFSSYPTSDTGDGEDDKEMGKEKQQPQQQSQERVTATPSFDFEQLQIPKHSYVVSRRSPQRLFPPPIPSLSRQDGASIRMQSRRSNGRLVLEAVSVPSANNFRALRQDGSLVLTFINSYATEPVSKNEQLDEMEEEFENPEVEEEEEEERQSEAEEEEIEEEEEERGEKEVEFVMESAPKLTSGVMNVHRLTLMGFANRDPRWPKNFNEVVKFEEDEEEEGHIKPTTIVAQSLSSPPRMARLIPKSPATTASVAATGASVDAYEYYWRPKPMVQAQNKGKNTTTIDDNNTHKLILSKKSMENRHEQQQLLVLRGNKRDYLVPLLKSCKEPRRSLLFWESYCAAIV